MFKQFILLITVLALSCATAHADLSAGNFVPADQLLGADQVRAEIVKNPTQFLGGPKRESRVGDFKIYNNKVGFIIAGTRPASGVFMFGGVVEEAGLLKPEGDGARWYNLMGDSCFALYKGGEPLLGLRMLAPVSAEIIEDGSAGRAVVRIKLRDAEWAERKELMTRPSSALKVKAIVDYILKPDTNILEMKITLINARKKAQGVSLGRMFLMGDGSNLFAPGHGFDIDAAESKEFPIFTSVGGGVSYGWFPESGNMTVNKGVSRRLITTFGKASLPPGEEVSQSVFMAVGDGGASSVQELMYKFRGQNDYGVVQGKCLTAKTKTPAVDAVIHALAADGSGNKITNTVVNSDGSYRMVLAPGKYLLQPVSYDRSVTEPVNVDVTAGKTTDIDLETGESAWLDYTVTDDAGDNIPAVISFKKTGGPASLLDGSFYFNRTHGFGAGFFKIHFATQKPGAVSIQPGDYKVYVSRGLEYEYEEMDLSFAPGQTIKESFNLAHVVDTTGYLSGDFHIHSQPSNDCNDMITDKVRAVAALGLEVPVATDHDVNTDYTPYIQAEGLQQYVKSIVGDELTTLRMGHFNAWPLTFNPDAKNWGAPVWFGLTVPEIMDAFRADPQENTIIHINHPRSGASGYFGIIGYDPETGTAIMEDQFTLNFDGMEVLNGASYNELEMTLPDWYSFLNRGKIISGFGNSDNHSTFAMGVGYPRNYVVSPTDVAGEMVEEEFVAAARALNITVSGGPFITVDIDGQGPGHTVSAPDGAVALNIKVQAPSWMETKTMSIIAGGETIQTIDLPDGKLIRYAGTINATAERDTWYVVIVEGEKKLFPVYPGARPYSFTNPIFVDVDGNGKYDAPLSF